EFPARHLGQRAIDRKRHRFVVAHAFETHRARNRREPRTFARLARLGLSLQRGFRPALDARPFTNFATTLLGVERKPPRVELRYGEPALGAAALRGVKTFVDRAPLAFLHLDRALSERERALEHTALQRRERATMKYQVDGVLFG